MSARPDRSAMRNETASAPKALPSSAATASTASTGDAASAAARTCQTSNRGRGVFICGAYAPRAVSRRGRAAVALALRPVGTGAQVVRSERKRVRLTRAGHLQARQDRDIPPTTASRSSGGPMLIAVLDLRTTAADRPAALDQLDSEKE